MGIGGGKDIRKLGDGLSRKIAPVGTATDTQLVRSSPPFPDQLGGDFNAFDNVYLAEVIVIGLEAIELGTKALSTGKGYRQHGDTEVWQEVKGHFDFDREFIHHRKARSPLLPKDNRTVDGRERCTRRLNQYALPRAAAGGKTDGMRLHRVDRGHFSIDIGQLSGGGAPI